MKILHVIPTYVPSRRYGGPIFAVHGLCRALVRRGHEVHVFTTSVDGPDDLSVPLGIPFNVDGVNVWYFPARYLRRLYWAPDMRKVLRRELPAFDLVHLHSVFLWPTWAAACAARRSARPYVVSPRGMLVRELVRRKSRVAKSLWLRLIEKRTLEHAAVIHATSALERDEMQRFGFCLPRISVVPNGVDYDFATEGPAVSDESSQTPNGPFFLFLGRINWKKGLDRLIPAMRSVPGVNLVIAGNDDENCRPQLETLAETHEVQDRVYFVGPVYGPAKQALLRKATALVLPSYSENFGNVVLEAMAHGCPVAVTEEVGLADVVRSSGAGLVVPGDSPQLGEALQRLISDAALRQRMGEQGRRVVAERYSWDIVAEQMESLYRDVVGGGGAQ